MCLLLVQDETSKNQIIIAFQWDVEVGCQPSGTSTSQPRIFTAQLNLREFEGAFDQTTGCMQSSELQGLLGVGGPTELRGHLIGRSGQGGLLAECLAERHGARCNQAALVDALIVA